MPNIRLKTRPQVSGIKHPKSGTVFYSDPSLKTDPDAKGIRLAVGTRQKVWWVARRIDGKVKQIRLGEFPELTDVYAARDVAKEKMAAVSTGTDAISTGLRTLHDALESHIRQSDASEKTHDYYRAQVNRHMGDLFQKPLEDVTLAQLEDALRPHNVATQKHLAQIIRTSFKRAAVVRRCFNVADGLKVQTKRHQPDNVVKFDASERWPALDLIRAKRAQNQFIATAYELMLFTGIRAGNVIALRWDDLDLDAGKLHIAKLKNGRKGVFPLCDRVVVLLKSLPQVSTWVFPQHDTSNTSSTQNGCRMA